MACVLLYLNGVTESSGWINLIVDWGIRSIPRVAITALDAGLKALPEWATRAQLCPSVKNNSNLPTYSILSQSDLDKKEKKKC